MAKQHKTMRGKSVNMDTLRIQNEKVIAIGNMNVNAGGDEIGPGGEIVKDRNQRVREHNDLHTMVPSKAPVSSGTIPTVRKVTKPKPEAEVEAEKILDEAETDAKPKGGLAASMATKSKKKKS